MSRLLGRWFFGIVLGATLLGCAEEAPPNPAGAEQTYGAGVEAVDAIPAPAVAAEPAVYRGRRVTVDGRIAGIWADGCASALDGGGGAPVIVEALRSGDGSCAWQLPTGTEGIAAAAGTLRVMNDTLRLSANGVQVTPVQVPESDS